MHSFIQKLASPFAVGVGARLLVQCLSFVSIMIASRVLSLAEFGVFALSWALLVVSNSFMFTGFYHALLRSHDLDRDKDTYFWVLFIMAAITSLVFLGLGLISQANASNLGALLVVFCLLPFLRAPIAWNEAQLFADKRPRTASAYIVVGEVIALIAMILALRSGWGVYALVLGRYTTSIVELLVTTAILRRFPRFSCQLEIVKRGWKTARSLWVTTATGMFNNYGADFLLGLFLTPAAVGAFRGGARIAQTASDLLATPLSLLSWARFSRLEKENQSTDMASAWHEYTAFGAAAIWPAMVSLALLSDQIVVLVFTKDWLPAAPIIGILCLARAIRLGSMLLEPTMGCRNKAIIQERIRWLGLIVLLVLLLTIGRSGAEMAAFCLLGTAVVISTVSLIAMVKELDLKLSDIVRDITPGVVISLMCIAMISASDSFLNHLPDTTAFMFLFASLFICWVASITICIKAKLLVLPAS
ncbi:oligosaccharide flippase family protein [Shimia abyssi]|uniref:O-antigen/teichoic acid export membrane protein n=1 Tax=Shimia abyssi TaxID=1662395 RepID=A0A2P8F9S1_9RHOB|nr:oligosaccharide flippase family protein [Shimia abyssi]PSL18459.1 O-antigen/teichoic acid export membrane protein [Shimia abyssi]